MAVAAFKCAQTTNYQVYGNVQSGTHAYSQNIAPMQVTNKLQIKKLITD
jgi:hypothetical protein